MLKVRCLLCLENGFRMIDQIEGLTDKAKLKKKEQLEDDKAGFDIFSRKPAKTEDERLAQLGTEIRRHMEKWHPQEHGMLALWAAQFIAFSVVKYFETEDPLSKFEQEKEMMRTQLEEQIMYAAPDDEDEDEDDENEDSDTNGDLEDFEETPESVEVIAAKKGLAN